ncbi:hypothetical protein J6590_080139 [Homalodisca vitripennis]|nr:hypothetical protein J6590_080139 [Homalodisca vitripennis]
MEQLDDLGSSSNASVQNNPDNPNIRSLVTSKVKNKMGNELGSKTCSVNQATAEVLQCSNVIDRAMVVYTSVRTCTPLSFPPLGNPVQSGLETNTSLAHSYPSYPLTSYPPVHHY